MDDRVGSRYSNMSSITYDRFDGKRMLQAMRDKPRFVLNNNASQSMVSQQGRFDTVADE